MLCHTVHGKVIAAMTNIQKEEVASNKVEKKEMGNNRINNRRIWIEKNINKWPKNTLINECE